MILTKIYFFFALTLITKISTFVLISPRSSSKSINDLATFLGYFELILIYFFIFLPLECISFTYIHLSCWKIVKIILTILDLGLFISELYVTVHRLYFDFIYFKISLSLYCIFSIILFYYFIKDYISEKKKENNEEKDEKNKEMIDVE